MNPQVGAGLAAAEAWRAMITADTTPFAFEDAAARRQLSARAPLLQCGDHPVAEEAQGRYNGIKGHVEHRGSPGLIGSGVSAVLIDEDGDPYGGGRDRQADA